MRITSPSSSRQGMTLLEVLAAMAIFLFSLAAISSLMSIATDLGEDSRWESHATRLAQSKMAEYLAGVESVNSAGGGDFPDEPGWEWSVDSQSDSTARNLTKVTVTVSREIRGKRYESVLTQYVFDPLQRGNVGISTTTTTPMME